MTEDDFKLIAPGAQVDLVNSPADAEQILVEGLAGIAVLNGMVKINCFQQFMDNKQAGTILGKYNVTLNIPMPQFIQMEAVFRGVVDDFATATAAGEDPAA